MDLGVNYPEVGATRTGDLPAGYRHLELSTDLDAPLAAAAEIVMTFGLQARCGLRPESDAPRATPGAEFGLQYLGLRLPCQVVWAEETPDLVGFGYGTRPGHLERGEASFLLEPLGPDRTRFTVRSFSVPGTLLTRIGAPVTRLLQTRANDRYLTVMRDACGGANPPESR
jgi:uncharacterized protein (UPF0548 family)